MTREELKEHCEKQIEQCKLWAKSRGEQPSGHVYEEHLLILELLEREPCEDAISRQITSDYVQSHIQELNAGYGDLNAHTNRILRMIVEYIEKMPSVTSTREHGEWIRVDDTKVKCSKCEITHFIAQYPHGKVDFCPNCGADMRKEQNNV